MGEPLAGLRCEACGALSMLPIVDASAPASTAGTPSTTSSALVADIVGASSAHGIPPISELVSSATTTPPLPPPALSSSSTGSLPSTSLPTPTHETTSAFPPDVLDRIRGRWSAPSQTQELLAERFEHLLRGRWSESTEHTALVKRAAADDELAFLGQRYRSVLDTVPNEPRARAAQNELLTLATAMMTAHTSEAEPDDRASGLKIAVAVATFLIVGGCVWWLMGPALFPPGAGRP